MMIIDDEIMLTGSTNMDNMSFFYSSELSVTIENKPSVINAKVRLIQEHLGDFYKPDMETDFELIFDTFKRVKTKNY